MMLNMLNVQITDRMIAGMSAGRSEGRVMDRSICQRVAPSMRAASYSSAEIDCSAPSETTIMKGKESQPFVASAVRYEVNGVSNQETGCPPKIWIAWLM